MALSSFLDLKFKRIIDNYYKYFIHEGDPRVKGILIPAEWVEVNKYTKTPEVTFIGSGIANMSKYLVYLILKFENTVDVEKSLYESKILSCLDALNRLSDSAHVVFSNFYNGLEKVPGFLIKDDVDSKMSAYYNTSSIVSSYTSNIQKINEDPAQCAFINQGQIWNLLPPMTYLYIKYPEYRDKTGIIVDILEYVIKNKHVIYNPYLSRILHNSTYLCEKVEVDIGEKVLDKRRQMRDKKFKNNIRVKRGHTNWYFATGIRSTYKRMTKHSPCRILDMLYACIYHPLCRILTFVNFPKIYSILCFAYSGRVWYSGFDNYVKYLIAEFNRDMPSNLHLSLLLSLVVLDDPSIGKKISKTKLLNLLSNYSGFSLDKQDRQYSDIDAMIALELLKRIDV